jgi:hypothetical protein
MEVSNIDWTNQPIGLGLRINMGEEAGKASLSPQPASSITSKLIVSGSQKSGLGTVNPPREILLRRFPSAGNGFSHQSGALDLLRAAGTLKCLGLWVRLESIESSHWHSLLAPPQVSRYLGG